jgi:uncharacterized protein YjiS (DUF1127 family)
MHRALVPAAPYDPPSLTDALLRRVAVWHVAVLAETRVREDERRLREANPRLLADVGLMREDVARGALRPRQADWT